MHYRIIKPTGILSEFVKHYCIMESDAHEPDVSERVIPLENIQLMFHYRKPFTVNNTQGSSSGQPSSIICGLTNTYFDACTNGETGVIFVSFHPVGACFFFDFPLIEIRNSSVDLSLFYKREISELEYRLHSGYSDNERISLIESFLVRRYSTIGGWENKMMRGAIDIIKKYKGKIPCGELARKLSVTERTLVRKFSEYVGITPKKYSGIIRFQNILLDIHRNVAPVDCCYGYGYFDQSHFIHDFRMYSGYTPGEYAALMAESNNTGIEFSPL